MKPYRAGTPASISFGSASMGPRAGQDPMPTSPSIQSSPKHPVFPRLLASVTTRNQPRSGAGVQPATLSLRTHRSKWQTPMDYTLEEAAIEPLYKHLLK